MTCTPFEQGNQTFVRVQSDASWITGRFEIGNAQKKSQANVAHKVEIGSLVSFILSHSDCFIMPSHN